MAKTVFGVPGIGDKSRKTAGDAVAPGGTTGVQPREKLPQKAGKESPSSTGDKLPAPVLPDVSAKPEGAVKPETPAQPEAPKPAGGPMMAKPVTPPMAKPAAAAPAAKPAAPGGGGAKTMFGMPALKLPEAPGEAQAGMGGSSTEPAKAPWEGPKDAAEPEAPAASKEGDAYKATVLGMSAVNLPDELGVAEEETIPPVVERTVSMPEISGAAPTEPPKETTPPVKLTTPTRGSARFPDNISSSRSNKGLVIAIIVLFVVLIVLVYYLFGMSEEPGVSDTASPPPAQAAPAVPSVPTAPDPGTAQ